MEIVKNHFIPGKKVSKYKEIAKIVPEMIKMLNAGLMSNGLVVNGYGLAHNQVEDKEPMSFFVLSDKAVREQNWPTHVIINPQIIEPERTISIGKVDGHDDVRSNIKSYPEACFSFPHKAPKNVDRYYQIKVKYQVPYDKWGYVGDKMQVVEETLEGLKAHIFQHEWQHTIGENIYYSK